MVLTLTLPRPLQAAQGEFYLLLANRSTAGNGAGIARVVERAREREGEGEREREIERLGCCCAQPPAKRAYVVPAPEPGLSFLRRYIIAYFPPPVNLRRQIGSRIGTILFRRNALRIDTCKNTSENTEILRARARARVDRASFGRATHAARRMLKFQGLKRE